MVSVDTLISVAVDTFVQSRAAASFVVMQPLLHESAPNRRMTQVKTYSTRLEADLAAILLRAEGIDADVVGVGLATEGGAAGVRLLVADDQVDAARELLAGH